MGDNILLDPLGYVARGIIRTPRYRLQPLSAEDRAEVEARHARQLALDAKRRDEAMDEDGNPAF